MRFYRDETRARFVQRLLDVRHERVLEMAPVTLIPFSGARGQRRPLPA